MRIKKIILKNYRNHLNFNVELCKGINILIGSNAQGKTNILEAIYSCAFGRSHRTSKVSEQIMWGKDSSIIELEFENKNFLKKIILIFKQDNKKMVSINSRNITRITDLLGNIRVVMFSPEDLKIAKSSFSNRRDFMNMELCQINPKYYYNLVNYNKNLKERNKLLKQSHVDDCMLDVYDEILSEYGEYIMEQRIKYIEYLNKFGTPVHSEITSNNEKIFFEYVSKVSNMGTIKDNIINTMKLNRKRDKISRITNIGIHRDYFSIFINGNEVKTFGSQGQQRTSVLTIKFASLRIISSITGDEPVLLLDDVLSELDINRQKFILKELENYQVLITCTGVENISDITKKEINSKIFTIGNN